MRGVLIRRIGRSALHPKAASCRPSAVSQCTTHIKKRRGDAEIDYTEVKPFRSPFALAPKESWATPAHSAMGSAVDIVVMTNCSHLRRSPREMPRIGLDENPVFEPSVPVLATTPV